MGGLYLWDYCKEWDDINEFIREEAEKRGLNASVYQIDGMSEYDWESNEAARYYVDQDFYGIFGEHTGNTQFNVELEKDGQFIDFTEEVKTPLDVGIKLTIPRPETKLECNIDFDKEKFIEFLDQAAEVFNSFNSQ